MNKIIMTASWVIWSLLILAQAVYFAVGYHVSQGKEPKAPPTALLIALAVASVLIAAASYAVVRKLPAYLLRRKTLSGENTGHQVIIAILQVIGWALATSVATYGLVLCLMTFDVSYQVPFAVASLLLFVATRPKDAIGILEQRPR